MGVFAWRRRQTRHFGEQWMPFAEVSLRDIRGGWQPFAFQIDTGAVISILPRTAAEYLGVSFDRGEPIDLASVGGHPHRYFAHKLNAKIGGLKPFPLRIAIAESDNVPNLLGRLDVLDHFVIVLDSDSHETRFSEAGTGA
jgi:hypothetical protein